MSNRSATGAALRPHIYQPQMQPAMQELLRTLADIDFAHDLALEELEASATEANLKALLTDRLKMRHRERRAPYVQMLAELHNRSLNLMGDRRIV